MSAQDYIGQAVLERKGPYLQCCHIFPCLAAMYGKSASRLGETCNRLLSQQLRGLPITMGREKEETGANKNNSASKTTGTKKKNTQGSDFPRHRLFLAAGFPNAFIDMRHLTKSCIEARIQTCQVAPLLSRKIPGGTSVDKHVRMRSGPLLRLNRRAFITEILMLARPQRVENLFSF